MLVDLLMPGMSGAELVDAMQHSDVLASIPVVLMSGGWSGTAEPASSSPNVVRVLSKPLDLEALFALLDEFCPIPNPTATPTV